MARRSANAEVQDNGSDWLDELEEVQVQETAPDSRLVERLLKSEEARLTGSEAIGYRFTVPNKEVAKSRIAEIRKAGGPQYANCGVGIRETENEDGSVTILFKARKRRTARGGGEDTSE